MEEGFNDLEKWMEKQRLPKDFDMLSQPDWIGEYVRSMMVKAIPAASSVLNASKAKITESKQYMIIIYPLGGNADLSRIRLVAQEDRIRLSGHREGETEVIKLPRMVIPDSCQASYDGTQLKVRLRKRPRNKRSFEAKIHGS